MTEHRPARPILGYPFFLGWECRVWSKWIYLFSVEPKRSGGRTGFLTIELRVMMDGTRVEKRRAVAARRWRAKDRAWRWLCRRTGARFESWHQPAKLSKAMKARLTKRMAAD